MRYAVRTENCCRKCRKANDDECKLIYSQSDKSDIERQETTFQTWETKDSVWSQSIVITQVMCRRNRVESNVSSRNVQTIRFMSFTCFVADVAHVGNIVYTNDESDYIVFCSTEFFFNYKRSRFDALSVKYFHERKSETTYNCVLTQIPHAFLIMDPIRSVISCSEQKRATMRFIDNWKGYYLENPYVTQENVLIRHPSRRKYWNDIG